MNKLLIGFACLIGFSGCSKPNPQFDKDYVLIEFAAQLEGQYHSPGAKTSKKKTHYHSAPSQEKVPHEKSEF
jgi:hypothetical protein